MLPLTILTLNNNVVRISIEFLSASIFNITVPDRAIIHNVLGIGSHVWESRVDRVVVL
jgi:hypothetical protein